MSHFRLLVVAAAVATTAACAHATNLAPSTSPLRHLDAAQRLDAISRAQVWTPTDVPAMDLRAGPQGRGAIATFASVTCNYVERKMDGATPKFTCELTPGDEVKVKYGADNAEVYGVVAATRLLWALGFPADHWYPVTVICHGCSADPHKDPAKTSVDVTFSTAAIERTMRGRTIETRADQGWTWPELDLISEKAGGASRAQRDALKLLAVMIQHTDSKAEQQRLICSAGQTGTGDSKDCAAPLMLIHDVGLTFGKASLFNRASVSGVNVTEWASTSMWEDKGRCVGRLSESLSGTLRNPLISEAGRKFLADLLMQLSDGQLRDLFEVARFPQRSHVGVGEWIRVFKLKRNEIVSASCPA
jgi:hypothetical protein